MIAEIELIEEILELQDHIEKLRQDGFRINEDLLATVERLKVELSLEQNK